ncbi:hypothetical protein NPIL_261391 [Nephila pilipes]|uniref:Uncharacterized protein n=1 Tax=Nephila pilipes TaxID=299642 RepID=A0A8X6QFV6_NEPPI|nr:hypothetical protein NPIL_261391 [Nephila pilipes]
MLSNASFILNWILLYPQIPQCNSYDDSLRDKTYRHQKSSCKEISTKDTSAKSLSFLDKTYPHKSTSSSVRREQTFSFTDISKVAEKEAETLKVSTPAVVTVTGRVVNQKPGNWMPHNHQRPLVE